MDVVCSGKASWEPAWLQSRPSRGFPGGAPTYQHRRNKEAQVQFLGREDLLEEGTATHSSILAWEISWTEGPGGLQSMGSQKVRHD